MRPAMLCAFGMAVLALAACGDSCENRVIDRSVSPDGRWAAVLFARGCGATTDISTHVALIRADAASPSGAGNVLVASAGEASRLADWNGPWAAVTWAAMAPGKDWPNATVDAWALVVLHDPGARIFQRATLVEGVPVAFELRELAQP